LLAGIPCRPRDLPSSSDRASRFLNNTASTYLLTCNGECS
jgi:hypothetical protein